MVTGHYRAQIVPLDHRQGAHLYCNCFSCPYRILVPVPLFFASKQYNVRCKPDLYKQLGKQAVANIEISCLFAGVKQPEILSTKDSSNTDCRCFPDIRFRLEPTDFIPAIVAPVSMQASTMFGTTNQATMGQCTSYNRSAGYPHQTAMLR